MSPKKTRGLRKERIEMYDEYATIAGFKKICRVVINLRNPEIKKLESVLHSFPHTKTPAGFFQFNYDDLYKILMAFPLSRALCEKQRYTSWEDLIARYLWKVEDFSCVDEEDDW